LELFPLFKQLNTIELTYVVEPGFTEASIARRDRAP